MSERGNITLRLLDKYAGIPLVFILGKFHRKNKPGKLKNIKKIALLKTAGIGDTVLLSAIISDIKDSIKDAEITLFSGRNNAEMAMILGELFNVDVITLPVKNIIYAVKKIRKYNFDVWIDFGQWSRLEAILSHYARAQIKIGFKTKGQSRHHVYDVAVLHKDTVHEVYNYKSLLEPLGIRGRNLPHLPIQNTGFKKEKLVVIHMFPGGVKSHLKEWPSEYWIKVIDYITEKGYRILLTGGKEDRERAIRLYEKCKYTESIEVGAGTLSLRETMEYLLKSMLVISVNTGIMHIASALGCNLIALHGPTSYKRWGPLNNNAISIQSPLPCSPCLNLGFEYGCNENKCMWAIEPESIFKQIHRFLTINK